MMIEESRPDSVEKKKIVIVEGEKKTQQLIKDIQELNKMIPDSAAFLGDPAEFQNKLKKKGFATEKAQILGELREEVVRVAERKGVNTPRKKLKKYLKKYPHSPDLRALNGIQIFNDTSQSGLSERKLLALKNALIEIAKALHNDGISIFHATWFIKVYLKYLESLKERITKELNSLSNHYNWNIQRETEQLKKGLMEVTSLISLRDKLNGLIMLNTKMKNTVYNASCITMEEVRQASAAMKQDETKTVGTGKTANYITYVVITLSLLFARIPILENLVKNVLGAMTDSSRDIQLQKAMISTMIGVTSFQMSLGSGESEKAAELSNMLYKRNLSIISQHLEHATLSKPHEIDPFLKAAWVVKESDGLFEPEEYIKMVVRANKILKRVLANPSEVKGSDDLARQLQANLQDLLKKYGVR